MTELNISPGPIGVSGLPLTRATMHPQQTGPDAWERHDTVDASGHAGADGTYWLCRCGASENKPFCDGSHKRVGFDGTETASTDLYRDTARVMPASGVVVRDDRKLCEHAGFCSRTEGTNVWKMRHSEEPAVLGEMVAMIDVCPSGALTHSPTEDALDDEPTLDQEVLVVDDGPYLVTGGPSVTRADGEPLESRNRMTLCRCGQSKNKPLCDGSHKEAGFTDH